MKNVLIYGGGACLVLLVAIPLLLAASADSLDSRVEEWTNLLESLPLESPEADTEKIYSFLEPSAGSRLKAEIYYKNRSRKRGPDEARTVSLSIDEIKYSEYSEDGKSATVRYTHVVRKGGEDSTQSELCKWRKIDRVWYRVLYSCA